MLLKDILIPEKHDWETNIQSFLDWCQDVLKQHPSAFSLDLYQKSAFPLDKSAQVSDLLCNSQTLQLNDIYHRYLFDSQADLSRIQLNRIRPCTMIHIKKYIQGSYKRVMETPNLYETQVLPYILSLPPSRTAWIHKGILSNCNMFSRSK